jgi:hypothetical protein
VEIRLSFFLRSVLAGVAYGLAYAFLRELSLSDVSVINWIPVAGLRLICLLLVPIQYWPAMIVAECISVSYENYRCLDNFGISWVVVASIPRMIYTAPIVYLLRKPLLGHGKCPSQHIGSLLLCISLASVVAALHSMYSYSLSDHMAQGEQPMPLWALGIRSMTSTYLSMLTIAPVAFWLVSVLRRAVGRRSVSEVFRAVERSHWLGTLALMTVTIGLVQMGHAAGGAVHILAIGGIVAVLTTAAWHYGWQSTTIIGAVANLGIIALMPTQDDLATIQAQCLIAVAISGLLLFAARTSSSFHVIEREHASRRHVRQELFTAERNRLAYAYLLDDVFSSARKEAMRLMYVARPALPAGALAAHYRELDSLYQRHQTLTERLSPRDWQLLGSPNGLIAQTLDQLGVLCEIREGSGTPDSYRLSAELSIASYRLSCEAVTYLMKHAPSDHIRISMASLLQRSRNEPGIKITIESLGNPLAEIEDVHELVQLGLGASGLTEHELRNRVQLYDGEFLVIQTPANHLRVVIRVVDKTAI